MAKYLMDYCLNHRREGCDERVKNARYSELLPDGNYMPIFPVEKAQVELDKICDKCSSAIFLIESVCPACNGANIKWGFPKKASLRSKLGPITAFHYICRGCGRDLYCKEVLIDWSM